ncbi:MAG: DUF2887 domain-containing protein [Acidobacteriota bacterium]|nr:DUF2887 domain-containing protein [Acidobacteriota bacterium]
MKSDTHFYQIFRKCPNLFADVVPFDKSAGYSFSSRAFKQVDRTYDGLFEPTDKTFPAWVVEFQAAWEVSVYPRLLHEATGLQLEEPDWTIECIIVFLNEGCDPKPYPWHQFARCGNGFRVIYLDVALRELGEDHPLYAVFQPFLEQNEETVKANAAQWLKVIRKAPLAKDERACLEEVFLSWLTQRFKTLSKKEIMKMFGFDTPVEETVFYKEVKQEAWDECEKQSNKRAVNAFEARLKGFLEKGIISEEVYQQEVSAFRAQISGNHGEA